MHHFGRKPPAKPAGRPWLVATEGPLAPYQLEVPPDVSYVGRKHDLALVLDSDLVDRVHARIRNQDGRVTIEDLHSTEGTFIGSTRVDGESELHAGDTVRFADVSLTYVLIPSEDESGGHGPGRWWVDLTKGAKAAILTTGALAGAVSAVLALWPEPDPEDVARVNAVQVLETRMPLSKYETRPPVITPAQAAGGPDSWSGIRLVAGTVTQSADASGGLTQSSEGSESPVSPTASPSPTDSPSPSETVSPTVTPSPTVSPSTSTPASPSALDHPEWIDGVAPLVDDEFNFPVEPVPNVGQIPRAVAVPPATAMVAAAVTDAQGSQVDKRLAARRVVRMLRQVRTTPISTSEGIRKDPVGALVDVDLELSGLRKQTVSLRWQVRRIGNAEPLFGAWMHQVEAYRLTASTQHDTATVPDMWVPVPKGRGSYVVRVQVNLGDHVLARGTSDPFS